MKRKESGTSVSKMGGSYPEEYTTSTIDLQLSYDLICVVSKSSNSAHSYNLAIKMSLYLNSQTTQSSTFLSRANNLTRSFIMKPARTISMKATVFRPSSLQTKSINNVIQLKEIESGIRI